MNQRNRDKANNGERRRYPKSTIGTIIVANGRTSAHTSPRNSPRDSPRNSPRDSPRNSPSLRSVISTPVAIITNRNLLGAGHLADDTIAGSTSPSSYSPNRSSSEPLSKTEQRGTKRKNNDSSKNNQRSRKKDDKLKTSSKSKSRPVGPNHKNDHLREIRREVNLDTPSSSRSPLAPISTVITIGFTTIEG